MRSTVNAQRRQILFSVVFFLNRLLREENLPEVSEYASTVVVSFGVVWCRGVGRVDCYSRMTVLTNVTSTFVPLVGGLVDHSQVGMKQGITGQEEEDKDHEAQHEDNPGESQEQMLERTRSDLCSA